MKSLIKKKIILTCQKLKYWMEKPSPQDGIEPTSLSETNVSILGMLMTNGKKFVFKAVLGGLGTPPPLNMLSPPYLIATPEVFYHRLTPNDCFLIIGNRPFS